LDDIVEEVSTLIPATVVAFYSPVADGTELEATNVVGSQGDWLKGRRVRVGERIVGWSGSSGRSVLNADALGELGELARTFASPLKSCLAVPLSGATASLGVLVAFSTNDFRAEDQRVLEAVARYVTPVLERLMPRKGEPTVHFPATESLQLTPLGMIACRCAASSGTETEPVGIALAVTRRHLGSHALTQIIHGNDIFIGIGLSGIGAIDAIADGLRNTLLTSGLISSGSNVVVAATPRDGTNLEHLLYACQQRLSRTSTSARVH
jgi:hypothetical protein